MSRAAWRALSGLAAGLVFGVGLAVAQMTDPNKVLDFLDVAGNWDPSLLFVLGGAVLLATAAFRVVLKRPAPLLDAGFHVPAPQAVDGPLIVGSALFGIGWGIAGYCPGPAIASLGAGNAEALWIVPALIAGAALQRWQAARAVQEGDGAADSDLGVTAVPSEGAGAQRGP